MNYRYWAELDPNRTYSEVRNKQLQQSQQPTGEPRNQHNQLNNTTQLPMIYCCCRYMLTPRSKTINCHLNTSDKQQHNQTTAATTKTVFITTQSK